MIDWADYKVWLAVACIVLSIQNYSYYIYKTLKGVFKPHLFSWGIWMVLGAIAFAAQFSKDAGPGMWQTACMTTGLIVITTVACFKGDKNYTRGDWVALLFALSAIPLWIVTNDPLWSVILITIIDVVATFPTMRKAYARPHEESARAFFTAAIICSMGILALSVFTVTTALYTGTIVIVNCFMTAMILIRRKIIPASAKPEARLS